MTTYSPRGTEPKPHQYRWRPICGGAYDLGNIFQLSFAATPAPAIVKVAKSGGQINVTGSGVTGRAYQLLGTTNLSRPNWLPVGNPITASNALFNATDGIRASGEEFYRLEFAQP